MASDIFMLGPKTRFVTPKPVGSMRDVLTVECCKNKEEFIHRNLQTESQKCISRKIICDLACQ